MESSLNKRSVISFLFRNITSKKMKYTFENRENMICTLYRKADALKSAFNYIEIKRYTHVYNI